MDASAIQRLEQIVLAGQRVNTELPCAIVPQGSQAISLERFMAEPSRHVAEAAFSRPPELIRYCLASMTAASVICVDPDNLRVVAIFDYDGGWGDHRAVLQLKPTPEWKPLVDGVAKFSQASLGEFVEDFGDILNPENGGVEMTAEKAVSAIRRITIRKGERITLEKGDFSATRSALEEVEAQGAADPIPSLFTFDTPCYEGLDNRAVKVKVSVLTDTDTPVFKLRVLGADSIKQDIAAKLVEVLQDSLGSSVYIGTIKHR